LLTPRFCSRKQAFKSGDFEYQSRMMDCILTAIERSLIGVKYVPKQTLVATSRLMLSHSPVSGTTTLETRMKRVTSGITKTFRGFQKRKDKTCSTSDYCARNGWRAKQTTLQVIRTSIWARGCSTRSYSDRADIDRYTAAISNSHGGYSSETALRP
jgi:hypothetical protein